jgi:uncharacterized protein YacL
MKERVKQLMSKFNSRVLQCKNRLEEKLEDQSGATFVDTLIGILIVLVVGSLIMVALNAFFPTLLENITTSISAFFSGWFSTVNNGTT